MNEKELVTKLARDIIRHLGLELRDETVANLRDLLLSQSDVHQLKEILKPVKDMLDKTPPVPEITSNNEAQK